MIDYDEKILRCLLSSNVNIYLLWIFMNLFLKLVNYVLIISVMMTTMRGVRVSEPVITSET